MKNSGTEIRSAVVGNGDGGKGQEGVWGMMEPFCVWIVVLLQDHVKAHLTVCLKRVILLYANHASMNLTYTHTQEDAAKLAGIRAMGNLGNGHWDVTCVIHEDSVANLFVKRFMLLKTFGKTG